MTAKIETKYEMLVRMERKIRSDGFEFVAGIDEAGRGPLAGPVVAAACILPMEFEIPGLNDSKKLSEKKRNTLLKMIMDQAVAYSLGICSNQEIDFLNILQATRLAMKRAVEDLVVSPDYLLIDGKDKIDVPVSQKVVIGGDGLCACIAAASILAKVTRDEIMYDMHEQYPEYCFDKHKGYGTKIHMEALKKFGPCPIHRRSFAPIKGMIS